MKKGEFIERYGEEKYKEHIEATIQWQRDNPELARDNNKRSSEEWCQKDGKYYEKQRNYQMSGLSHEKRLIRGIHAQRWRPFKQIIAPESQIHHEWLPGTADYRGAALVEADSHMHGFIDVIQILEGEITLLTEAEIRGM